MRRTGWKDWLVYSDVHILIVAAGWMLGASALVGYVLPWPFLMVGSIGAFLVYRLDHVLVESPEDVLNAPERRAFVRGRRVRLLVSSALLACLAALILLKVNAWWWVAVVGVGVVGMIYPLRVLPGGRRPKDIALVKSALIVACWVGGGVLLPAMLFAESASGESLPIQDWVLILGYRAAYVLPNLIAMDWLDREGDHRVQAGNLVGGWSGRRASLSIAALWALAAAFLVGHVTLDVAPTLLLIEMVGLTGLCILAIRAISATGTRVGVSKKRSVGLDLWVSFPIFSWLFWFFG